MDNVCKPENIFPRASSIKVNDSINQPPLMSSINSFNSSLEEGGKDHTHFPRNVYGEDNNIPLYPKRKVGEVTPINVENKRGPLKCIYSPIKFWFEEPSALFQTFDIVPNQDMTDAERLNAMTRVVIIITAIMFIVKFPLWWMFLVIGIITVIVLWYIVKGRDELYADHVRRQTEYLRRPRKSIIQTIPRIEKNHPSSIMQSVQNQPLKLISLR